MTGVVISDKNVNVTVSKSRPCFLALPAAAVLLSVYCNSLASSRCSVTALIQRWDSIQIILADAQLNVSVPQFNFSFPETFSCDVCASQKAADAILINKKQKGGGEGLEGRGQGDGDS